MILVFIIVEWAFILIFSVLFLILVFVSHFIRFLNVYIL